MTSDVDPTRRVLGAAAELGEFTTAELASVSGASYEMVQELLDAEKGRSVENRRERATHFTGRRAEIWYVSDEASLRKRLAAGGEPVSASVKRSPAADPLNDALAAVEDDLFVAFGYIDDRTARDLARRALLTVEGTGIEWRRAQVGDVPTGAAALPKRNLTSSTARACVAGSIAEYLASDEEEGLHGPLWRRAFFTVAAIYNPLQAELHKQLLVELVRIAEFRTSEGESLSNSSIAEVADHIFHQAHAPDAAHTLVDMIADESEADRQALRSGAVRIVSDLAQGERRLSRDAVRALFSFVARLFEPGSPRPATELRQVTEALCAVAMARDPEAAVAAQEALVAIGQPRQREFWLTLSDDPANHTRDDLIFRGIAQTDLSGAFEHLTERLARGESVYKIRSTLVSALAPACAGAGPEAQEHFADFLAGVTEKNDRLTLAAVPAMAGLDWPLPNLDYRLARQFFGALASWRASLHSDHRDEMASQRALLASRLRRLAPAVIPALTSADRDLAIEGLLEEVTVPAADPLPIAVLLSVNRADVVAHQAAAACARTSTPGESAAGWYVHSRDALRLAPRERRMLLQELYKALPRPYGDAFIRDVADNSSAEDLNTLAEYAPITEHVRAYADTIAYGVFTPAAPDLDAIAISESYMEFAP